MDEHVAWLRTQRQAGHVMAWGRRVPRDGGVILANGSSRDAVEALANEDPFVTGGAAEVEVIEWAPSFVGAELPGLELPGLRQ